MRTSELNLGQKLLHLSRRQKKELKGYGGEEIRKMGSLSAGLGPNWKCSMGHPGGRMGAQKDFQLPCVGEERGEGWRLWPVEGGGH